MVLFRIERSETFISTAQASGDSEVAGCLECCNTVWYGMVQLRDREK